MAALKEQYHKGQAEYFKHRARDFEGKLKQEVIRANEQALQAAGRLRILKESDRIILDGATKLRPWLPDFYRDINDVNRVKEDARDLVRVLVKELESQVYSKRGLEIQINQHVCSTEYAPLQIDAREGETTPTYKTVHDLESSQGNSIPDSQDSVELISRLEAEKRALVESQDKLKLDLENEKRRMDGILRLHNTAERGLEGIEEKHNRDKLNMQQNHDIERNRLQNNLKQCEDEVHRLHAVHDTEKRELHYQLQQQYDLEMRGLKNSLHASHDVEMSNLQAAHDTAMSRVQQEKLTQQRNFDGEKKGLQNSLKAKHDAERNRIQSAHDTEMNRLQLEKISLENRMSSIKDEHEAEKKSLIEDHESKKHRLISRIQDTQARHDSLIEDLQERHQSTVKKMKQEYNSATTRISQEHEREKSELEGRISQMKKEHASEEEKMKKDFEARKQQLARQTAQEDARLKADFKSRALQLEVAHADEKARLRKDVNALSAALLARDEFRPMPDNEIKARFMDLAQDVDALARLEWKHNRSPWTTQVLRSLASNQRLLKKQILQDRIWDILHEYIFCSPFRIFGEEGGVLEKQWNEACGISEVDFLSDSEQYQWPKPAMETERWRYVTVKECRAALRQPIPSEWDPRAKLKKGFKTSIDALREDFTEMLDEMGSLDKTSIQAMEKMTIKAANTWLEFGMQRCRILVVLHGSSMKSMEDKIRQTQEGVLRVVVVPQLKRFGNSKGLDLDIEETVGGCDGQIAEVSMQQGGTKSTDE